MSISSRKRRHSLQETFEPDAIPPPKRGVSCPSDGKSTRRGRKRRNLNPEPLKLEGIRPYSEENEMSNYQPHNVDVFRSALAQVVAADILESCGGCKNNHLSQTEHSCLLGGWAKLVRDNFDHVFDCLLNGKEGEPEERVWRIMENSFLEDEKELRWMVFNHRDTFGPLSALLRDKIREDLLCSHPL